MTTGSYIVINSMGFETVHVPLVLYNTLLNTHESVPFLVPGEFATQTCFQGRFGETIGSDQFGGCIMFHAPEPGKLQSIGRIEYVEVTVMFLRYWGYVYIATPRLNKLLAFGV